MLTAARPFYSFRLPLVIRARVHSGISTAYARSTLFRPARKSLATGQPTYLDCATSFLVIVATC